MSKEGTFHLVTLHFEGESFNDGGISLSLLSNLYKLEKILNDIVTKEWKKNNPLKPRLPKGFKSNLQYKLYDKTEGSVRLEFRIKAKQSELYPKFLSDIKEGNQKLFLALKSINENDEVDKLVGNEVKEFVDFLPNLSDADKCSFETEEKEKISYFTNDTRRTIARMVGQDYLQTTKIIGTIRSCDLDGNNFKISSNVGVTISGSFEQDQEEQVLKAFFQSQSEIIDIEIFGDVLYNSDGKPKTIKNIKEITTSFREPSFNEEEEGIMDIIKKYSNDIYSNSEDFNLDNLNIDQTIYGSK